MESLQNNFEQTPERKIPSNFLEQEKGLLSTVLEKTKSKFAFAALALMSVSTGCAEMGVRMKEIGGALKSEIDIRNAEIRAENNFDMRTGTVRSEFNPTVYNYNYNASAGLSGGVDGVHVDSSINRSVVDLRAEWERKSNAKHK